MKHNHILKFAICIFILFLFSTFYCFPGFAQEVEVKKLQSKISELEGKIKLLEGLLKGS